MVDDAADAQSDQEARWSREPLDARLIAPPTGWPSPALIGSVESTFHLATRLAAQGAPEGSCVVAEEQTAGRGRLGRSWASPRGAGLWLTLVVDLPAAGHGLLPVALGLAVRDLITSVLPVNLSALVKWPNDVVIRVGRAAALEKVAGVLVEVRDGRALAGVGINVSLTRAELPVGVAATSLALSDVQPVAREVLLAGLLGHLQVRVDQARGEPNQLLSDYRAANATLGRQVEVVLPGDRRIRGQAVDIGPDGALVLELSDGNRQLVTSGDVIHATI